MKIFNYVLLCSTLVLTFNCKDDDDTSGYMGGCVLNVPCDALTQSITPEVANDLEENYKNYIYEPMNNMFSEIYPNAYVPVRDVWFSIDELKRYLLYVEEYGAENGLDNLGIRVYLGAYAEGSPAGELTRLEQTVFFIPTTNPSGGDDVNDNENIVVAKGLNYGGAGDPTEYTGN